MTQDKQYVTPLIKVLTVRTWEDLALAVSYGESTGEALSKPTIGQGGGEDCTSSAEPHSVWEDD